MTETALSVLRVMVVDDQRAMRSILRELLHANGIRDVLEATNGEDAMARLAELAAKRKTPDVILCDLHMEKMDGMELIASIRRGKERLIDRKIPILLLTGENDELMLGVMQQLGATQVLHKPISAGDLAKAIASAVGVASA